MRSVRCRNFKAKLFVQNRLSSSSSREVRLLQAGNDRTWPFAFLSFQNLMLIAGSGALHPIQA